METNDDTGPIRDEIEPLSDEEKRYLEALLHEEHERAKKHGARHDRNIHIATEANRRRRIVREILRKMGFRPVER